MDQNIDGDSIFLLQGKERAGLFLITTDKGIVKHLLSLFSTWTIPQLICSSRGAVKVQEAVVDGKSQCDLWMDQNNRN